MRAEQPQSFGSTGRLQDFIAVVFEQHLAADELTPLVVNAENCCFQPRDHCLYISSSARVGFFYRRTSVRGSRSCVVSGGELIGPQRELAFKITNVHSGASYQAGMGRRTTLDASFR